MVSPQPILSLKYFRIRKNKLSKGTKRLFYLSWEDALWDILLKKNAPKNSHILVPDFYCADVEKNIKLHGYRVATYKILKNLDADQFDFEKKIKRFNPAVVVVFHPAGINSNLFDNTAWLKKVTGKSILIEDAVHKIINPSKIKIIKKNHYIIDSLRKVVPVQGSNLYGRTSDIDFSAPIFLQSFFYKTKVNFLWFLMEIAWSLKLFSLGEKLMIAGYDLIGDSRKSASGSILADFFAKRVDGEKLFKIKKHQAKTYQAKLREVLPYELKISDVNRGELRGYPVILPIKTATKLVKVLRNESLLVRFELEGSKWTKKQKIIYLPLGPQLTKECQNQVCELSYNTLNAKN